DLRCRRPHAGPNLGLFARPYAAQIGLEVGRARDGRPKPGKGVYGEQYRHRRGILPRAEAAIVPSRPAECKTRFSPPMDELGDVSLVLSTSALGGPSP